MRNEGKTLGKRKKEESSDGIPREVQKADSSCTERLGAFAGQLMKKFEVSHTHNYAGLAPKRRKKNLEVDSSCTARSVGLVGELLMNLEESYEEQDTQNSNNSESEAPSVNRALLPYLESTAVKQISHDSDSEASPQPYTPSTGGKSSIESEKHHETPKESTPIKQIPHDGDSKALPQPYTPSTGGKSSIESEEDDHETPKVSDGREKRPKLMEPETPATVERAIAENLVKLVRDSTRECETEMAGQKIHTAAVLLFLIEKMCREAQKVLA